MTPISPSPSPSPSPNPSVPHIPNSLPNPPVSFSPPLIAMVIIIATAFITITYSRTISRHFLLLRSRYRNWRRRRRLLRSYVPSSGDVESPYSGDEPEPYDQPYGYGLDDAVIKSIPVTVHTCKKSNSVVVHECAVCLLEFEDNDYVRTLPVCFHSFHVDCIDIWLRCHANCPLCRSTVFLPIMSPRIPPSFHDVIIHTTNLEPELQYQHECELQLSRHNINNNNNNNNNNNGIDEIIQEVSTSPTRDDRFNRRNLLLKRSYSFGFERSLGSSRSVMEAEMVSPLRYRRYGGSVWSKKPSPSHFGLTKTRVLSFRHSRGMKYPFFRRRSCSFIPLLESDAGGSDSSSNGGIGRGGSSSSRRRRSFASPSFMRQGRINSGVFSSSRLRSGDPEALLSPERYDGR